MRILFDQGTPRGIANALRHHQIAEARSLGWDTLSNGDLLAAAERAGFDVFLTTDKNLGYQQNLANRKIAIVVLGQSRWRLVQAMIPSIVAAIDAATPGSFTVVPIPNT
jgi:hypothetical protein